MKTPVSTKMKIAFWLQLLQLLWLIPCVWRYNVSAETLAALPAAVDQFSLVACMMVAFGLFVGIAGLLIRRAAKRDDENNLMMPFVLLMSLVNVLAGSFQMFVACSNVYFAM